MVSPSREAIEAGYEYVTAERVGGVHRPLVRDDVDAILGLALPIIRRDVAREIAAALGERGADGLEWSSSEPAEFVEREFGS